MWKKNVVELPRHLTMGSFSNGLVAAMFGAAGPLLIVLQAAAKGHLSDAATSSWILGIYGTGGILTLIMSFYYRLPIGYAFSIPGVILVGDSLAHHSLSQVTGAYLATGLLILLLSLTGFIRTLMRSLPLPVMMGMVAGVLLPFGTDLFRSVLENPLLNGIPLLVFLILSLFAKLSKKFPPILGAMLSAAVLLKVLPGSGSEGGLTFSVAIPQLVLPSFDLSTMGELVVPLVLTVVAIQNAQGIAVLRSSGYEPPVNSMSSWSGIGCIVNSMIGAHSACVAGPMTAILADKESGSRENRYAAAIVLGVLACLVGLFAPMAAAIPHLIPASLIKMLGGMAMIGVLIDSFKMSFSGRFKSGALFSFLITVSGISILHIGAPFWGLIGGMAASLFLDRKDYGLPSEQKEPQPQGS